MIRNSLSKVLTAGFLVALNACATAPKESVSSVAPKPSAGFTSPADVIAELENGNRRFISGGVRQDGQSKSDIERLSKGQSPRAVVLSCSDSRLPPEAVFDQKIGEIFTVRSAGETLSAPAIASVEYAVAKLGTKLIVVLGHTHCGAVKAAVETIGGASAGSPNLDQLVADIHPRILATLKVRKPEADLREVSWANANGVARDLATRSTLLSDAIRSGRLKIQVGLYDLGTGSVEFEK